MQEYFYCKCEDHVTKGSLRFVIQDVSQLQDCVLSEPVYIRNLGWRIVAKPEIDDNQAGKTLGVFIECDGVPKTRKWSCYAHAVIKVITNNPDASELSRVVSNVFSNTNPILGEPELMPWSELLKNYRVNGDTLILEATIKADSPKAIYTKRPHLTETKILHATDPTLRTIPKLLFIGAGNIVQSILKGILRLRPLAYNNILVTAPSERNLRDIEQTLRCNTITLECADDEAKEFKPEFVFLCMPPDIYIRQANDPDTHLYSLLEVVQDRIKLSLMPGVSLPKSNRFMRIALNNAAEVGASSVFYLTPHQINSTDWSEEELYRKEFDEILKLLRLLGPPVIEIADENLFNVSASLCGSGLALFYEMIQAVSDAAVREGLPHNHAKKVAARMAKGAGKMVAIRKAHPYVLRDRMCIPAGATIEGINKWHEHAIGSKIGMALKAATQRYKTLSKDLSFQD